MKKYIFSNLSLIEEYSKLYKNGIDIDFIIESAFSKESTINDVTGFGRFRIFIDSCLLLFNKEKVYKEFAGEFSYIDFLKTLEKNEDIKTVMNILNENEIPVKDCKLFYPLANVEYKPWEQVNIIRRALAHMQYGYFAHDESGLLLYYGIYNKDSKVPFTVGWVIEQIVHIFISTFFSNYYFGLPHKHTFFSNYSFLQKRNLNEIIFYKITKKKSSEEMYNGFNSNIMKELSIAFTSQDPFVTIERYQDMLIINEMRLNECINIQWYNLLAEKLGINNTDNEYYLALKGLLDIDTEISNFLLHLGELNTGLYIHAALKYNNTLSEKKKKDLEDKIIKSLKGLKEDEGKILSFRIGFTYLKAMTFALRLEDDDLIPLNLKKLNVDYFNCSNENMEKYCNARNINECRKQSYVIERFRNSLMHGNIRIEVNNSGDLVFIFVDDYRGRRKEELSILIDDLDVFLSQKCLYEEISLETPIIYATKKS